MSERTSDVFAVKGNIPTTNSDARLPVHLVGARPTGVERQYASSLSPFSVESFQPMKKSVQSSRARATCDDELGQSMNGPSMLDTCLKSCCPPCLYDRLCNTSGYSHLSSCEGHLPSCEGQ